MGSVALADGRNHGPKSGFHKPRRAGIKLDMTPLVDVAFLLLTFFMFATTMSQPQVMEIQAAQGCGFEPVAESNLLRLYVRGDNRIFYRVGGESTLHPISLGELKEFATQRNVEKENRLITALKVDQRAQYSALVDVLDELNLAEGELVERYQEMNMKRERRFTIAPMDENDKRELETL
jgi:biopolymer transport protein ExbD